MRNQNCEAAHEYQTAWVEAYLNQWCAVFHERSTLHSGRGGECKTKCKHLHELCSQMTCFSSEIPAYLLQKAAFRLSVGGECWSYKPRLCLIPKKCSANAAGNLRDVCSRQTERVRHGKREGQARLGRGESYSQSSAQASIWVRMNLVGWMVAECESPWIELRILDFHQKAMEIPECVGAKTRHDLMLVRSCVGW